MRRSRVPSPARSQGAVTPTPRRKKSRGSRSVCSPALSTASGRLTSLIDQFKDKNADSYALSPLNCRSVLNDNTDIEEPRRRSWWKKLGENSQSAMEVLDDKKVPEDWPEANNVIEDLIDVEVLSQGKKNFTLDLPESSDNESINSIVLPQRRLFTQKENQPHNKFGQLMDNRENLAKLNKTNANVDKTVNAGTRELFQNAKRSKPVFPAALLQMSPNKTAADKTKENIVVDPKPQVKNIFGNRPASKKRKNIFANFIASESEEEIPEIQPRVFGFQRKLEARRVSSVSKGTENSPMSSITTDMDMDGWKHLPSSTMVENQLEEIVGRTPVKRPRLSKLSEAKESETGINTLRTDTTGDKTKQSNKSTLSKNKSKISPEINNKSLNNSRVTRSALRNASKLENNNETPSANKSIDKTAKDKNLNVSIPALEDVEIHNAVAKKSLNRNRSQTIIKDTEPDKNVNLSIPVLEDVETTNKSLNKNRTRTIIKENGAIDANIPAVDDVETQNVMKNDSLNKNKTRTIIKEVDANIEEVSITAEENEGHDKSSNKSLNKNRTRTIVKEPESDDKTVAEEVASNEKGNKTTKKIVSKIPVPKHLAVKNRKEEENAEIQKNDNIEQNDEDDENNFSLRFEDEINEGQAEELNNIENNRQDKSSNQNCIVIEKSSKQTQENHIKSKIIEESGEMEAKDNVDGPEEDERNKTKTNESEKETITQDRSEENRNKDQVNEYDTTDEVNKAQVNMEVEDSENVDDGNKSQDIANESQIEEQAEEAQESEKEADEDQDSEDEADQSQEVEEEADEDQESEEEADQSQEVEEEAEQSQEVEEDADQSQEVEEADESQEVEEKADQSQDVEEADESQEITENEDQSEEEAENSQEIDDANETQEANENEEEAEVSQEVADEENEQDSDNQDNESDAENESQELENDDEMNDSDEADKAIASDNDTSDDAADDMEIDDDLEDREQNASQQQNDPEPSEEVIEESPNVTHDTTGRNRNKKLKTKSPEAILNRNTNHADSFVAKGRNTSITNKSLMIKRLTSLRPSLAPARDSVGFSDGTKDSSAEGSGWDSHRTTRKTLRQTFGKDFTPRKSLRALVMEKSAKRQTENKDLHSETVKHPQANSTELPDISNRDEIENIDVSNHEVSIRTRKATLVSHLEKIRQQNAERRIKIEEAVRNSLKFVTPRDPLNLFKVPSKPAPRRPKPAQSKPKKKLNSLIPLDELPSDFIQDLKYKPPKRFQPANASWITKRLYKYLETKLEPKYDYKARVRAEQLVEKLYYFTKDLRKHKVAPPDAVEVLKHEFARLDIVTTHYQFYNFFHDFMPREVRIKVNPDIVNNIPLPRNGIFSNILQEYA